jgi:hypothetical protein
MFNFGEKLPAQKLHQTISEEDRLFFEQIREKASNNSQVIQTALTNPLDKFQLGIRKLIEEFMVQRTRAVSEETTGAGQRSRIESLSPRRISLPCFLRYICAKATASVEACKFSISTCGKSAI